jgi:hypothetical protein
MGADLGGEHDGRETSFAPLPDAKMEAVDECELVDDEMAGWQQRLRELLGARNSCK